jgi:tRNA threonylcarbamoyladenosine biosynthesis protein TsaE
MAVPQPRPEISSFELPDEAATAALGRNLAALARAGDVIALAGELGTGKTAFARAFINALPPPGGTGPGPPEEVPSPTFTLLQIYERAPAPVWHFDLYRLERPADAWELGFEEALEQAITLIEWPERLGPLLPAERLDVCFAFGKAPDARRVSLLGSGDWPVRLRALGRHD